MVVVILEKAPGGFAVDWREGRHSSPLRNPMEYLVSKPHWSYIWGTYLRCIKCSGWCFCAHVSKNIPTWGGNKHVKSGGVFHSIRSCVSNVSDSLDGYPASKGCPTHPWTPKPWKMKLLHLQNMGEITPRNEGCGFPWHKHNFGKSLIVPLP